MMKFLKKQFRPWSLAWIVQRSIVVIKEGRLPEIRMNTLLHDRNLTRNINANLKTSGTALNLQQDHFEDDFFNFIPAPEYHPLVVGENTEAELLSAIHKHFDHIYVLNLGRRIDRRIEMIQKLSRYKLRAEIFEAEDGSTPENQQAFHEFYRRPIGSKGTHPLERSLKKKMIASPGAWGYLKTYKKILLDAKKNHYRNILCFDDDVIFQRSFESELESALGRVPPGWKLIYLGASQHKWNVPNNIEYPDHFQEKDYGQAPYYYPVKTDGSFAVGIDSSVFDEILEQIELMNCALDSGPLRAIQQKYRGLCFVLTPNLVIADVSQSDIGVERDQGQLAGRLRWKMEHYDHPFQKELVSVIMPAFNAEKTIEKSIRSILMQNYRELEMIVADDGSTDSTPEIVQRLLREDSRVRLVRLESNQGCYPARNAALRASKGRFIAIQDSDDISLSTRIETQLVPLLLGRAEFTLTRIFRSRCSPEELDLSNEKEMIRLVLDKRVKKASGGYEYIDRPVIGFMTSMFTRKLFEELGLFWESRFGADAEFLERVLFKKAGILLSKKDGTIHSYLMNVDDIPGIYKRIDKVQLISTGMTADNITNRHSRDEKAAFEETWRKRFRGETGYRYPVF
jgi:glycosyltransferase involved in cell wall biosynthesis/GR25 family glycosyltransferase involved in LPS biosynthesis